MIHLTHGFCLGLALALLGNLPPGATAALSLAVPAGNGSGAVEEDAPTEWVLSSAPEPSPALQIQFVPEFIDQVPGNAALVLQRALILMNSTTGDETKHSSIADWLDLPPSSLLQEEGVQAALNQFHLVFQEIEKASRRETCSWELPIREETVGLLLPDLIGHRNIARALALKIRLAIANNNIDEALEGIRTGLTYARQIGGGQTLIHGLVGLAMANLFLDQVKELIQLPDAPNLYWALTTLPSPPIDPITAFQGEFNMPELLIGGLRDAEIPNNSTRHWRNLFLQSLDAMEELVGLKGMGTSEEPGLEDSLKQLIVAGIVMMEYPPSRDRLIGRGRAEEEIASLPVGQVVAVDVLHTYRVARDGLYKWLNLPYWQAHPYLQARLKGKGQEVSRGSLGTLVAQILPAISHARLRFADLERDVAFLKVVEALRMHAAINDNALPNSLDEVFVVPLPVDPLTGVLFNYKKEGRAAHIQQQAPEGLSMDRYSDHHVLKFRP